MNKITKELREIYLKDLGVDISSECDVKNEKAVWAEAKKLFEEEVHPLFLSNWGDVWLKSAGITTNFSSPSCKLWVHALYGVKAFHVAKALNNYLNEGLGAFPPNPLRFREYCKAIKHLEEIQMKSYAVLN